MNLSVGILYSAIDLLKLVASTPGIDQRFPNIFKVFSVASPTITLEMSLKCGWLSFNIAGYLDVTTRGKQLLGTEQPEIALRLQLIDFIDAYNPSWVPLLKRGRSEALRYLLLDIQQCFKEAALLEAPDDIEVVKWWDNAAQASRSKVADIKMQTGRVGERLSLEHERKRTHREPIWQAFESNLCGYDILSVTEANENTPLRIEVKASDSTPDSGIFYVTRNEWTVAQTSECYVFHLWSLKPEPKLFVINVDHISSHIPCNKGEGQWEDVTIPFRAVIEIQ
jgi:hypothetical protein